MQVIPRTIEAAIRSDLSEKMVFIGGPRQVGKTTLALQFLDPPARSHPAYLNWDVTAHRQKIRREEFPLDEPLIVVDEVHKFRRWRGLLKGLFDQYHPARRFLVTGSARLDHYRRGGDSLQGRYHYWRLHPFTVGELSTQALPHLLQYGGFPEPFQRASKTFWRRWSRERLNRIVREDLRDLERVRELDLVELLLDALPAKVGSLLSYNALAEDLGVSPRTVERWTSTLESLYVCYRIAPWGPPAIRAVKKAQKLYLWDWAAVESVGARFENLVASHLLKYCHLREDTEGHRMELRYLRDTAGHEVDFVVLQDRAPLFAVECKHGDRGLSPAMRFFRERTKIPAFYQVHGGERTSGDPRTEGAIMPFGRFCEDLGLP